MAATRSLISSVKSGDNKLARALICSLMQGELVLPTVSNLSGLQVAVALSLTSQAPACDHSMTLQLLCQQFSSRDTNQLMAVAPGDWSSSAACSISFVEAAKGANKNFSFGGRRVSGQFIAQQSVDVDIPAGGSTILLHTEGQKAPAYLRALICKTFASFSLATCQNCPCCPSLCLYCG